MNRAWFMVLALCACCLAGAAAHAGALPEPTEPAHQSGGIGDDDPLLAITGDYNLQLVFAAQGSGEYLADVKVSIADAADRVLLEARSPGPLFYVRLPAGSYRVTADFAGKSLRKVVAVNERRIQHVNFYWPGVDTPGAK